MVNLAQLLTIDKARLQKRLGQLGDAVMERINDALRLSLDV
jgi:mRNA-degrading endonuclease toxin of MazEF toxin-antitoxin module